MRFAFIQHAQTRWPVDVRCRVLHVSRSGFYAFVRHTPGPRERRRGALLSKIQAVHAQSRRTYGSPRIHQSLKQSGECVGKHTVARIMKDHAIQGKTRRKRAPRTTDSRHGKPVADNVLDRQFTTEQPNKKWASDITYIPTDEGWLYLAAVIDLCSRKIVGWATADHMRSDLVIEATQNALARRRPRKGLLYHSDRGSQYVSDDFQTLLKANQIDLSMSRKGDCWDNAVIESFWGSLKGDLQDEPMPTHQQAHDTLFEYIEVFYNRQRLHSSLGYLSPAAYEAKHHAA